MKETGGRFRMDRRKHFIKRTAHKPTVNVLAQGGVMDISLNSFKERIDTISEQISIYG